jgi:hypothetical protein
MYIKMVLKIFTIIRCIINNTTDFPYRSTNRSSITHRRNNHRGIWLLLLYGEEMGSKLMIAKLTYPTTQHVTMSETRLRKASFHVL